MLFWLTLVTLSAVVFAGLYIYRRTAVGALISYVLAREKPIRGHVSIASLEGPLTKHTVRFLIYLPEGYESSERRYNVIYHLHGAAPLPWHRMKRLLGVEINRLAFSLEKAVESGLIDPAIIVAPHDGYGRSMWSDSKDGKAPVETRLIREFIPHIDATYRTEATRSSRVIEGFSMGGFGAMKYALKYPDMFSVCVSYDGAIHNWETLTKTRPGIAKAVFGGDEEYFQQYSPWSYARPQKQSIAFRSNVGLLRKFNRSFRAHLQRLKVPMEYTETSCSHNLFCLLTKVGQETFEFIGKHLRNAKLSGNGFAQPSAVDRSSAAEDR